MATQLVLALVSLSVCAGLSLRPAVLNGHRRGMALTAEAADGASGVSTRRGWLASSTLTGGLLLTGQAAPASARLAGPATPAELARIRKGYEGLE
jgi:hypothetical protein